MTASLTDQVTAWSTLAAVIAALGIALAPALGRRFRRPTLEVTVGDLEPHRLSIWEGTGHGLAGSSLRVQVRNAGRRTATDVRARLQAAWIRTPNDPTEWGDWGIDPSPLIWSSRVGAATQDTEVTVLPSGLNDLAEFTYWNHRQRRLEMKSAQRPGVRVLDMHVAAEYRFQIVVTCAEADPVVVVAKVVTAAEVRTVELTEGPGPETVRSLGLFSELADWPRS